jgi:hypothetical protein
MKKLQSGVVNYLMMDIQREIHFNVHKAVSVCDSVYSSVCDSVRMSIDILVWNSVGDLVFDSISISVWNNALNEIREYEH